MRFAQERRTRRVDEMRYSLSFKTYRLPMRQPLRTAHGWWAERQGLIVRLENVEGQIGWGEVAPIPGWGGGDLTEATTLLERLGTSPVETEVDEIAARGGCVGFGLGAAMGQLRGQLKPEHEYLPVTGLLPAGREALRAIEQKLELGFRVFKWKVGVGDARDEQVLLDDLMGILPEGSRLRLDANGGWERRVAERWLEVCAERPMIEFVEQPTDPENKDLLLGLVGDYPTTLALDEAVIGREDFDQWIELGWPGVFVLKPALWGDPRDLVERVRGSAADVVISSSLETAIGARQVLEIAFELPKLERALGTGVWPLFSKLELNGPSAVPFVRAADIERLNSGDVWEAI